MGGGPAGAACAWRLKMHGVKCLILDQHNFPRPKTCAGWITPEALQDLEFKRSGYPYSFTTFSRFFITINKIKFTLRTKQYAIRRIEFDNWLLKKSGAAFQVHKVQSIVKNKNDFEIDGKFSAKFLVGAGGTYCPVYRALFKSSHQEIKKSLIVAQEEEFLFPNADMDCRLWFSQEGLPGYAWYVPKANGYINVGVGAKANRLKDSGDTLKHHWKRVVEKVENQGLIRGHIYRPKAHTYYLRDRVSDMRIGNAFVVGDAAGLATLDMGEGIGAAIRSGILAADSILDGAICSLRTIPRYSLFSILRSGFLRSSDFE